MWKSADRECRKNGPIKTDQRSDFERDRDRVLYSSAFHRLAGITQVVRAGDQEVFHTRQQHSIKVAQVGRRLAQKCVMDYPIASAKLGIDPEVVDAACLAHDLGHPPFGHAGEAALDELAVANHEPDGFEGNAQTFRILTRLGIRFQEFSGLDLTRATLAACLKYPWLRVPGSADKSKKWSVYGADEEAFKFARAFHKHDFKTAEAALMDWADDIAYSVHDLEDFHRCGAIPWLEVFLNRDEIVKNAVKRWHNAPSNAANLLRSAIGRIEDLFLSAYESLFLAPYVGTEEQRFQLRNVTSTLIGRYIGAVSVSITNEPVRIAKKEQAEVLILKQIFKDFIIESPALIAQQRGQTKVITNLFNEIHNEAKKGYPKFLPVKMQYLWKHSGGKPPRFTTDCIASMTEREVVGLHARLFSASDASVLDPIVR